MRKLAIAAVLASTALASPALARDDSWYIGVEGGPMIVERLNLRVNNVNNQASAKQDAGFDVAGIIGYDFGGFRLEAEVGYRQSNLDEYISSVTVPSGTPVALAPPGNYRNPAGKTSALSFMINGMLDFGDDDGIQGFIGGGAGVARVKLNNWRIATNGNFLDDSDTGFAYQGIAGVRAPISDNIDVSLKYRFFNADRVDLVDRIGRTVETRFRSHSILGGITYNFYSPPAPVAEPAPLPPPPEPAPPPPPAAVCTPGPYIVFFEWDKSDITAEAASILDNAVTAYGDCGQAQVMLAGYTDTSGTPTYNLALSQRRADAVSAYMGSKGIPSGVITTRALGETNLRVATADGVRELQNRRVEITYGPGSGM